MSDLVKAKFKGPGKHALRVEGTEPVYATIGEEVELSAAQAWNYRDRFEFPEGFEPSPPNRRPAYMVPAGDKLKAGTPAEQG